MLHKIIKKIKSIKKIYPNLTFKIVDIFGNPNNKNTLITYQVSGKSTISIDTPHQIINELMYMSGFSKKDSDLIYQLALEETLGHSFRIKSINLMESPIRFEIEDIVSNFTLILTAEEITSSSMLKDFSLSDISIIYYQLMKDNEYRQKEIIKSIKSKNAESEGNIYFLQKSGAHE